MVEEFGAERADTFMSNAVVYRRKKIIPTGLSVPTVYQLQKTPQRSRHPKSRRSHRDAQSFWSTIIDKKAALMALYYEETVHWKP